MLDSGSIIEIRSVDDLESLTAARDLVRAHVQAFSATHDDAATEQIVAALPAPYVAPTGGLWIAWAGKTGLGCAALHGLTSEIAELKRMYVRPEARGRGVARRLTQHVIASAAARGYSRLRLGTLTNMHTAQRLYTSLGFRLIEPYRSVEFGDTLFYELCITD
jgi:ribosomal protein S18 acetylase RimI-like enzyme